jgi:hypothetical protein
MGVVEMSIKETKEQMAALPDSGWVKHRIVVNGTANATETLRDLCTTQTLKALADSHTALLDAIKQDYKMSVGVLGEGVASTAFALSNDAVKEAEDVP